jgi:lipocalin
MKVVRDLDLERYMGRWYEIACFPSRFQPKNGANTRATYTLDPAAAGTVKVLNETWTDGRRGYIEGTAYRADPASDEAKLKVKFYVPPFLPVFPVVGDYWVLHVDHAYQYALVGQPSRNYLWVRRIVITPSNCNPSTENQSNLRAFRLHDVRVCADLVQAAADGRGRVQRPGGEGQGGRL